MCDICVERSIYVLILTSQVIIATLCISYAGFFVWSLVIAATHDCEDEHNVVPLIVLTVAVIFIVTYSFVKQKFADEINESVMIPLRKSIDNHWYWLKW